jgi:hypothetical protein
MFILWAVGAVPMDPATGSILQLIGGLGQSAAAVAVVWMFLGFLKGFLSDLVGRIEAMIDQQAKATQTHSDVLREFNRSVNGICKVDMATPPARRQSS